MLSFFRKKSSDQMENSSSSSGNEQVVMGADALLAELGYSDTTELKETIYGKARENFTSPIRVRILIPHFIYFQFRRLSSYN